MFQFQKASVASKLPASNWSCNLFRWFRWHGWKHFCVIKKKGAFFSNRNVGRPTFFFSSSNLQVVRRGRAAAGAAAAPPPRQNALRNSPGQALTENHHRAPPGYVDVFGMFFEFTRVHNRCFFWVHRVHNRCFLDVFSSFAFVLTV